MFIPAPPAGAELAPPPTATRPAVPDIESVARLKRPEGSERLFAPEAAPAPAPSAADDLWQRIRDGFALPEFEDARVRSAEAWYTARPDYVARMVERSQRYLFHVVEEVEKRGMPTEIALLPVIESAYNPVAHSHARAMGIWQFIPSTGKNYGLKQNWWYDGRRDVIEATRAALDYLQNLHAMFGDWELALAAYNWGEGAVARALLRNQAKGLPLDYHSLKMPAETRGYVPKLMAVKNIVRDPAAHGLELAPVPNRPYFQAVTATRHMDVKLAASLAEIPVEEFLALNPGYSRPVITAEQPQTLLLPVDKAATFVANLADHDRPLVSWKIYRLKPGEKLETVAARHGITLVRLKEVNGIPARGKVRSIHSLLVPAREAEAPQFSLAGFVEPKVVTPKPRKVAAKKGKKKVVAAGARKPAARKGANTRVAVAGPRPRTR